MISVIIPTYNGHERAEQCINSVLENTQDIEIIVIDNGSDPPFKPPFSGFVETVLIRNEENTGFPRAINAGIEKAKGDIILLLNDDVVVTPGSINCLASYLDTFSIIGPVTNYAAGLQRVQIGNYENKEELYKEAGYLVEECAGEVEEVNWVIGFCMMLRRDTFDLPKPFDESLWPCCGEEIDFCLRARAAGHRVGIAHDVYVHHEGSKTFKAMMPDTEYEALCERNDAHLAEKWGADFWYRQVISTGVPGTLKDKHKNQTVWIIGKGPSLQYLKKEDIGEGVVIALNEATLAIEELDLPNVTYSMQKDGGKGRKKSLDNLIPDCDYPGAGCGECDRLRPKKAGLLLHDLESKYCFPDYPERYVLNLQELGLSENVFSLIFALKVAQYMGCNKIKFVCCDIHANADPRTYVPGMGITGKEEDFYSEQLEKLTFFIKDLNCQFITPDEKGSHKIHLAIGVPCSFPFIPASFFYSFVLMEKPAFTFIHTDNGHISDLRNNLVDKALEIGATHLIMMDVDQVYHSQTITRLLSHRLPVVGALVHRRYPPFDSLMLKKVEMEGPFDRYDSIDEWKEEELIEVDATGGGCLMFNMDIFRKMPRPWFRDDKAPEGALPIGEDIALCQDLKAAGYKIYVDTSVPAGHLTNLIVNTATNRLYRACKSAQAAKAALGGGSE